MTTAIQGRRRRAFLFVLVGLVALTVVLGAVATSAFIILPYREAIDLRVQGDWLFATDDEIGFTAAPNASSVRIHVM